MHIAAVKCCCRACAELDSSSLTELESSLYSLSLLMSYAAYECQRRGWFMLASELETVVSNPGLGDAHIQA